MCGAGISLSKNGFSGYIPFYLAKDASVQKILQFWNGSPQSVVNFIKAAQDLVIYLFNPIYAQLYYAGVR